MNWREPIEFSAGDTLSFTRALDDYPATDGWHLVYELRGQAQPIEFTSTASGASHLISVAPSVTAGWLPGDYVLSGYAADGTDRFQVYQGELTILPNAQALPGNQDIRTFAQRMVDALELAMLAKAGDDLAASQIGETRFQFLTPEQLRTEHGYWKSVRRQEIAMERAKAGLPTGNKIRMQANVTGFGLGYGVSPFNYRR